MSSRSLSSGGTYADEDIYIERRPTPGSGSASSGTNSVNSDTDGEVPEPFRYKSPTKEQLERSGPIPEHIYSLTVVSRYECCYCCVPILLGATIFFVMLLWYVVTCIFITSIACIFIIQIAILNYFPLSEVLTGFCLLSQDPPTAVFAQENVVGNENFERLECHV
ncbi:hypothetical protein SK128_006501, partial [Halocaridina rubra]